jgi:periplasmic copper chaperone A
VSAPVTARSTPASGLAAPEQQGRLADLARSAAAPALCAIALIGLLSAYVALSGARIARVQVQVTLAALPLSTFGGSTGQGNIVEGAAGAGTGTGTGTGTGIVGAYLTIRNLAGSADELTGASTPAARRVILTRHAGVGAAATQGDASGGRAVAGLAIAAYSTVTLSPFGSDVVLVGAARLRAGQHVPLTLTFRQAGRVTVEATVTAPGAP